MPLEVLLAPAAAKDLDGLGAVPREQVVRDLDAYAAAPDFQPPTVKRLKGYRPPLHRLRSGDFRILFRVVEERMNVYRIINRKELERALKRLK